MPEAQLAINANSGQLDWARMICGTTLESNYTKFFDPVLVQSISSEELKENYEAYGKAVLRLAVSLLHNQAAAEDLAHDVFIRYWTSNKYDPNRGTKLNYLLTLTQSMALNQLNKNKNRKRILEKWSSFFKSSGKNIEDELQTKETTVQVQLALANLSEQQRKVLELCYIDGLSHHETAKTLNLPLGTVKTHARRGLIAMRSQMIKDGEESS